MSATRAKTSKPRGRITVEPSAKRVRAYLGGELVADTTAPLLVWEKPYYPTYYVPLDDVAPSLQEDGGVAHSPSRGDGRTLTVSGWRTGGAGAALRYPESPIEELRDLVRLDWDAMDSWFEEDEQVFVHPRDPYTRIDILPSSRHVRVESTGRRSPTRPPEAAVRDRPAGALLPAEDARPVRPAGATDTITHCPYKGQRGVLGGGRGDERPQRPGVVVPDPAAGESEGRRAGRVLQREGRHLRRR